MKSVSGIYTLTDRLVIRDLTSDDLSFIHELHSEPEVQKYATLAIPENLVDSERYLDNYLKAQEMAHRCEYGFCITLAEGTSIGLIGLSNCDAKFNSAELWFKISPNHWGAGYCTEAALKVLDFAFATLQLHRLEAGVDTENKASIVVLEKIGMQKEGIRRKILPIRGQWRDNFHYAILEEDWF